MEGAKPVLENFILSHHNRDKSMMGDMVVGGGGCMQLKSVPMTDEAGFSTAYSMAQIPVP